MQMLYETTEKHLHIFWEEEMIVKYLLIRQVMKILSKSLVFLNGIIFSVLAYLKFSGHRNPAIHSLMD